MTDTAFNSKLSENSVAFLRAHKASLPIGEEIPLRAMLDVSEKNGYTRTYANEMNALLDSGNYTSCLNTYRRFCTFQSQQQARVRVTPITATPTCTPVVGVAKSAYVPLKTNSERSAVPPNPKTEVVPPPYVPHQSKTTWATTRHVVWNKCTAANVLSVLGGVGMVVLLGFVLARFPYADCSAAIGGFFSRPPLIEVKGVGESLVVTDGELFAFIKGMPVIQGFAARMEQTNAFYQRLSNMLTGTTGDGGVVKDLSDTKQTCSDILKEISETRAACNATTRLYRELRERKNMISTTALSNIRRRIRLDSKHRNVSVLPQVTPVRTLMTSVSDVVIRESQMINQAQTLRDFDNELNKVRLAAAQDKADLLRCYESEKQERLTNVSALVSQRQTDQDEFATWKKVADARIKELEDNQLDWVQGLLAGVVIGALSVTLVVVVSNPVVLVTLARGGGFGSFIASPIVWFLNYFGVEAVVDAVALGAENAAAAAASAASAAVSATNAQASVATAIQFLERTARVAGSVGVGAL